MIPFAYNDNAVRVISRDDGPWFVLGDVCAVLSIGNPTDAAKRLDTDEKCALDIIDPIGRRQNANIINESGLWSLVLTSRKPEAKRFKKWLTSEVIPSIRKTGSYGTPVEPLPAPIIPNELLTLLKEQAELIRVVREQLVLKPLRLLPPLFSDGLHSTAHRLQHQPPHQFPLAGQRHKDLTLIHRIALANDHHMPVSLGPVAVGQVHEVPRAGR